MPWRKISFFDPAIDSKLESPLRPAFGTSKNKRARASSNDYTFQVQDPDCADTVCNVGRLCLGLRALECG